jgi:hypothetical protein
MLQKAVFKYKRLAGLKDVLKRQTRVLGVNEVGVIFRPQVYSRWPSDSTSGITIALAETKYREIIYGTTGTYS